MDKTRSTNEKDDKWKINIRTKEKSHWEGLNFDWRIILKWILSINTLGVDWIQMAQDGF